MKTYYIFFRNAETHYKWEWMGTTRANSAEDVQKEIWQMEYRNPDTEFKYEEH